MNVPEPWHISRRGFLRRTIGALSGVAVPVLLSACTAQVPSAAPTLAAPAPATQPPAPASTGLPSYMPLASKPRPDLPSTGPLFEDAYLNYPANPGKALPADPPGAGHTISALVIGLYPPATPVDQNQAWQAINKALNVSFEFTVVPAADFPARLGTLMAGSASDLPDIVCFFGALNAAPNVPQFVQRNMADLTPYLAGDAIRDYPNLAAIPTFAWKISGSAVDRRVSMIPLQRPAASPPTGTGQLDKNATLYDQELGPGDYTPKNADDYKRILKALTKPASNVWGSAGWQGQAYYLAYYAQVFGAPNGWALDASTGKLVKDIETAQYKEAVGFVRDLVAAGVMHPDSPTISSQPAYRDAFLAGKFVLGVQAFGNNWYDIWTKGLKQTPPVSYQLIKPFAAHDGAKPVTHLGGGYNSAAALKPASPERIKEILRVMNWLAAPFGSQEDLLLTYGVPEVDYKLDPNGNPLPSPAWVADVNSMPWRYVVQHPQVIYFAGAPDFVKAEYEAEQVLIPAGISDPTFGYSSPTGTSKGVILANTLQSAMDDIVAGRRPLSDYDQVVKDWQANGGELIRKDYQDALAAGH
jgi:putative aldouronate transport system substrate-binding protein